MASSRNKSRSRGKRPTATIDLKAKDVSEKVDASKVLAEKPASATTTSASPASRSEPDKPGGSTGASSSGTKDEPAKNGDSKVPEASTKPATTSATSKSSTAASSGSKSASSSSDNPKSGDTASTAKDSKASDVGVSSSRTTADSGPSGKPGGGMGGLVSHLVAGGIGGILALFGVSQFGGQVPGLGPTATDGTQGAAISEALESRLAAIEMKASSPSSIELPAELETRLKSLQALETKLASLSEVQDKLTGQTDALESQVKSLADPAGGGAAELRRRLDSMEGTITSLAKSAEGANGQAIPQLAALAGRLNDLRTELGARITATQKATFGEVEKRLAAVDTAMKANTEEKSGVSEAIETLKGGNQRLSLGLETARAEAARITTDLNALRKTQDETVAALNGLKLSSGEISERLTKLESTTTQNISALPSQDDIAAAIAPVTKKLSSVEEKVGGVLKRESARAESARKVLLSLELANLQRALDQGRPVASEIAAIKKSAPEGMDLSILDKLAANDVPSQEELVREFAGVASTAIQAETLGEDASAFDKLFASARSVVRVRRTGDVEGDTTEAVIARAEDKLKRDDLNAAVGELSSLKDKAAEAFAEWITRAKDRLAIDTALSRIEDGLKSAVSSSATN